MYGGFREYGYVNTVMLQQHAELWSLSMESRDASSCLKGLVTSWILRSCNEIFYLFYETMLRLNYTHRGLYCNQKNPDLLQIKQKVKESERNCRNNDRKHNTCYLPTV